MKKIAGAAGMVLEGKALERASRFMPYGLALSRSPLYVLLRRWTGMGVVGAGLATGTAMSLIADEMLTPLAGFRAPNRAYPW